MMSRSGWLFGVLVALMAKQSVAQSRTAFTADVSIGAAAGKGGEFFDREMVGARLAASVRRVRTSNVGMFAELSMEVLSVSTGHRLVCYLSPRGGCMDSYPEFYGPTAVLGITRERTDRRLEGRIGVGGGAYRGDGTLVGAVVSQADVAWLPAKHLGIVLGARWIVVPRFRHDRLWMTPVSFGLRLR